MDIYQNAYLKSLSLNHVQSNKNTIAFTDDAWLAHIFFTNKEFANELYPMIENEFYDLIEKSDKYYGM